MKFSTPDLSDKRILFARDFLEQKGYINVDNNNNADFVLLGINPDRKFLEYDIPIFAGNINLNKVTDYSKDETFAVKNAFLTAEAAVSIAINESDKALSGSDILIIGYGRIGKALHYYLKAFTGNITVCARNEAERCRAELKGAAAVDFSEISNNLKYDIVFNTVPNPVLNEPELSHARDNTIIIDLASFPGGTDKHFAKIKGINLITARGLPGKFSPVTAGEIIGETVYKLLKEVKV